MQNLVCTLLFIYSWVVILRIVMGMVVEFARIPWGHPIRGITDFLGKAVDPVLRPIRRFVPALPLGAVSLDLSPIILIIGIAVATRLICG